jgi:hypothetical protein
LSEWHQPILKCYKWLVANYQASTSSLLSTFWAIALAAPHYRPVLRNLSTLAAH